MAPVLLCWMKKRKGRLAQNRGTVLRDNPLILASEAATASVPSSVTSTKGLCTTLDRCVHAPVCVCVCACLCLCVSL